MALEDLTGTKYIDDLNSSNPAAGDNVSEGDDHIRGIKNVLKTTFPNIDGAVNATDTDLSNVLPTTGGTMTGGLNINTADDALVITSTGGGNTVNIISTSTTATDAPELKLYKNSSSPAINDQIGYIGWHSNDDAGNETTYASMYTNIDDETDGTEDGSLHFKLKVAGSDVERLAITSTGIDVTGDITLGDNNPTITMNDSSTSGLYHTISSSSDKLVLSADAGNVDGGTKIELLVDGGEIVDVSGAGIIVTGSVTANSAIIDNITIDGNTISSTNTNGNIIITPNGTGNINCNADVFAVQGTEGEGPAFALQADESDDAGDEWRFTCNTDQTLDLGNNISGSTVPQITFTPHATIANASTSIFGNVGIGEISPLARLHVTSTTSNTYGEIRIEGQNRGGKLQMYNAAYPVSSINTDQSGNIYIQTSGAFTSTTLSTKFTIATAGDVTVDTGNLVIGTAGKGIDFSANTNDAGGMTAEILDDYEEGDISSRSVVGITATTNTVTGTYTKIGRLVTEYLMVTISGKSGGTGNPYIPLSFAPSGDSIGAFNQGGSIGKNTIVTTAHHFAIYGNNAQAYANFMSGGYIGNGSWVDGDMGITVIYEVA